VVVGSTTVEAGEVGTIRVSVMMHQGMGGPHLFHIFVRSSDPENPNKVIKVRADIVPFETWRETHPFAFYLPRHLAEKKLLLEIEGIDAIAQAQTAFGHGYEPENAFLGTYEKAVGETQLLVVELPEANKASEVLAKIVARMKKSNSAANPLKETRVREKSIYSLNEERQELLFFQHANYLIRLSSDPSVATQSLKDVLNFLASEI
jgi:hypothetical protein